ncbi:unnamed protein product, partial [Coregonus sp. 'balchen']
MLYVRLLAAVLIMINTWLLNSAQLDHIRRYKRTMAQRADSELAHLASEQCRSTRQPRQAAYSSSVPHLPPVAHPRRYTTRQSVLYHITPLEESSCSGGCNSDANSNPGLDSASHWGNGEKKVGRGNSEAVLPKDKKDSHVKIIGMVSSPRPNSSRKPPSRAEVTVDSNSDNDKPEVDGGRSEGPHKQLLLKKQQRVLTGRVRRSLAVSHGEDSWAAFPENVVNSRGIFSTFWQHSDYSAESEDYAEEQEGPPSPGRASTLWGAQIPDIPPKWMSALYFNGQKEQLRVNPAAGIELPRAKFSVELWVNPEGGQTNPAIIAGVFDNCSNSLSEKGWSVGIRTVKPGGRKDARFFFTLRTDRAPKATTIYGHQRYHPNSWTHLMASYNGHKMTLYIDGAKVGESSLQSGNLYSPFMETCRTLLLGGDQSDLGHNFRGHIRGIVLWVLPRTHEDLLKGPSRIDKRKPNLALWADFSKVEQQWSPHKEGYHPSIVIIPIPEQEHVSPFLPPPCGLTACDNTDIILGYNNHWQLRTEKRIRYRIVNICKDDRSHPTVSQAQIQMQHQALVEAFRSYNISFELSTHTVQNTSLRQRFILSNCRISKIGNRHCDAECDHPLTGHDGGDCLRLGPCYNWKRRDGVCNTECNSIHYDYDDGDCCDPEELKEVLHLSSTDTLNVFFANNSAREELAGTATWPWAKEALNHQGGMVMNPSYFGTVGHNNTMIHEMGHIFGLYHVFKGVSERESCDDPCQETTPSMETGDLCADTAPTPKSKACHDPGHVNDTCGITLYQDTPYNNYMIYENWLNDRRPTPIPLKPMVIRQSSVSVSIHWLPPVRGPLHQSSPTVDSVNCRDCEADGVFHQYAYEATSPRGCILMLRFLHPVVPNSLTAIANIELITDTDESLDMGPQHVFCDVPLTLRVHTEKRVAAVKLSTFDEKMEIDAILLTSGPHNPLCSSCQPLIYRVVRQPAFSGDLVQQTLLTFTDSYFLSLKALYCMLIMLAGDNGNQAVLPGNQSSWALSPKGKREKSEIRETAKDIQTVGVAKKLPTHRISVKNDVVKDEEYQYRVQVEADGLLSELSPPLLYTHGAAYCGDGLLQRTEDCDDGNLLDGDGCSKKCHMESGFNCNVCGLTATEAQLDHVDGTQPKRWDLRNLESPRLSSSIWPRTEPGLESSAGKQSSSNCVILVAETTPWMDTCSPPQLEHASVTCNPGTERTETSHCTVHCHQGFTLTVLSGKGHPPFQ